MAEFGDQTCNAFGRIISDRTRLYRNSFGTIELFEAIQSCRAGIARQLLRDVNAKAFQVQHPNIGELEYAQNDREGVFTPKAIEVLGQAVSLARKNGDNCPGNDHLLLALVRSPRTTFQELLRHHDVDTKPLDAKLEVALGLKGSMKPRTQAYEICAFIECDLKATIVKVLKHKYGEAWWTKGVPPKVRIKCAEAREEEMCELDADAYFTLINLKSIMENQWELFGFEMQVAAPSKGQGKSKALGWMNDIRDIRNAVMHPSKRNIHLDEVDKLRDAKRITESFIAQFGETES